MIMLRGRERDDSLTLRCVDASDVPIRYLHAIFEVTHLWKRNCVCDQGCELGQQDAATTAKCLPAQMVFVRGRAKPAHDSSLSLPPASRTTWEEPGPLFWE